MADQQKIKKIETVLQGNTAKAEDRVRELTDALDAERRKSMVDERKIQEVQKLLDQKVKLANEMSGQMAIYAQKEQDD